MSDSGSDRTMTRSQAAIERRHALYTADGVRALDALLIQGGVSGMELMQRAASASLKVLLDEWPAVRRLVLLCGAGNNAGDGYLLAVLAKRHGLRATLLQLTPKEKLSGDALKACEMAESENVDIHSWSVELFEQALTSGDSQSTLLVDAMLGTGLKPDEAGGLREPFAQAVQHVNASFFPVLAIDMPTGLLSDTGKPLGLAIEADITVTFIGLKQGQFTGDGPHYCGRIRFDELHSPLPAGSPELAAELMDIRSVQPLLRPRSSVSHKGDCGHVLVVGGDRGFGGAAMMCAQAAARAGAGTVSLITRAEHVTATLTRCPEVMVLGLDDNTSADIREKLEAVIARADVIVLGPGLGRSNWSISLMRRLMAHNAASLTPMVLDADALNILAQESGSGDGTLRPGPGSKRQWVITPHPGEAARLLDTTVEVIQADRFAAIRQLQQQWGGVCLLKGAGTLVADVGEGKKLRLAVCSEGNPGMATGGMGDVLGGIIGALIAQGLGLSDAVRCAVCVHGESADIAASRDGQRGMVATDLLPYIRQLVNP